MDWDEENKKIIKIPAEELPKYPEKYQNSLTGKMIIGQGIING